MATAVSRPPQPFRLENDAMNTLPDPRTPSPSSALSRSTSTGSEHQPHPDLSAEVAMLSTKLINAINHQTGLDDSLQQTRHQLEIARDHIAQLEAAAKQHTDLISQGLLIKKEDSDKREAQLWDELSEERRKRSLAEKEKKGMEQELETLTTALFEEANTMVAAARKEKEASDKKNDQLRSQLNDTEVLLASHQEQLRDLKSVMEQMSSERDDDDTNTHVSTVPSTPGMGTQDKMSRLFEVSTLSPNTPGFEDYQPEQPLKLTHLIQPVLRSDVSTYDDFQQLLKTTTSSKPASRVGSGNFGSLNVMGLGVSNASSSSLGQFSNRASMSSTSSPATPNFPPNSNGSASPAPRDPIASYTALKDTKFWKRAMIEDIEPTLRLDIAPGVSWLARRTVLGAITANTLVIEPAPPASKFFGPVFACAMCGENRKADLYARRHRFRTSDQEDAARYPLCEYCLLRIRSTCDYIAFLKMVRDGHWRAETEEERKGAWEESVRLRERMFWSRVGGGVVPSLVVRDSSPRSPTFKRDGGRESAESARDPFHEKNGQKRVSIGDKVLLNGDERALNNANPQSRSSQDESEKGEDEAAQQLKDEMRKSQAQPPANSEPHKDDKPKEERLSFTIPGGFSYDEGITP